MTNSDSNSTAPAMVERDTATAINPPAAVAVSQLITATNRVISDAHTHGRKRVSSTDWMMSRIHFAIARRLARLAYSFAVRGKGRMQ